MSITLTGGAIGIMLLPVITQFLLEIYGWRGAILLLGAIDLNTVAVSALQTSMTRVESSSPQSSRSDDDEETATVADLTPKGENAKEGTSSTSYIESHQLDEPDLLSKRRKYRRILLKYVLALSKCSCFTVFRTHPALLYLILLTTLHGATYIGWTVFVIPNALSKGIDDRRAALLALAGGLGNTVGRIAPSLIKKLNEDMFTARNQFMMSSACAAVPFFLNMCTSSYALLALYATLNGMAIGAKTTVKFLIAVELLPKSCLPVALAFSFFGQGFGELTGGWLMGKLMEINDSLDDGFIVLGCVEVTMIVIVIMSLLHDKISDAMKHAEPAR